jgi:DNA mismatch repair protein MLH1
VDWDQEQACLHGVARELGELYALPVHAPVDGDARPSAWLAEHVVFPALRVRLQPPLRFATDGTCVELASLSTLYKVFERC